MTAHSEAWKSESLVRAYLEGLRGAIPLAAEQIDAMLRLVAAGLAMTRFADLGCGDGMLARTILDAYPQAHATLVDFSEPMLRQAREQLKPCGARSAIVFGDLADPAWVDAVEQRGPFELVVSGYAIHHLADERKRALYGEVLHLLTPGGLFVNIDHVKSPTTQLKSVFEELLIDSFHAYPSTGSGKTREEVAAEYVYRPDKDENVLAPLEDQCVWLRELGFEDVDCYFKLFELAVFGGRRPAA